MKKSSCFVTLAIDPITLSVYLLKSITYPNYGSVSCASSANPAAPTNITTKTMWRMG